MFIGATYYLWKGGVQDPTAYQRVIDYACGAVADCEAIQSNGFCLVANNPKAICDNVVNSYFQDKGQVTGSLVMLLCCVTWCVQQKNTAQLMCYSSLVP